jgi:hypothetical protein
MPARIRRPRRLRHWRAHPAGARIRPAGASGRQAHPAPIVTPVAGHHGAPSSTADAAVSAEDQSNAVKTHAHSKVFIRDKHNYRAT